MGKKAVKSYVIAVSYPREKHEYVEQVVTALAQTVPREAIFFDIWYEAQLGGKDLLKYFGEVFQESTLVVPFFCTQYKEKVWCQNVEWGTMLDAMAFDRGKHEDFVYPVFFDEVQVEELPRRIGRIHIGDRSPRDIADLLIKKLADLGYIDTTPTGRELMENWKKSRIAHTWGWGIGDANFELCKNPGRDIVEGGDKRRPRCGPLHETLAMAADFFETLCHSADLIEISNLLKDIHKAWLRLSPATACQPAAEGAQMNWQTLYSKVCNLLTRLRDTGKGRRPFTNAREPVEIWRLLTIIGYRKGAMGEEEFQDAFIMFSDLCRALDLINEDGTLKDIDLFTRPKYDAIDIDTLRRHVTMDGPFSSIRGYADCLRDVFHNRIRDYRSANTRLVDCGDGLQKHLSKMSEALLSNTERRYSPWPFECRPESAQGGGG